MVFPPIGYLKPIENAHTVAIGDFDFEIQINGKLSEAFPNDTYDMMRKRLEEQFRTKNLEAFSQGEAEYTLKGKLVLKENVKSNGLIVPAVLITIVLYPIGMFFANAFPANDFSHEAIADASLEKADSERTLFNRNFQEKEFMRLSGYQTGNIKKPDSRLNRTLASKADAVLLQIANEVAKVIDDYERASSTLAIK